MVKFRALCSGSWGCWLGRAGPVLGLVAEDWASAESCRAASSGGGASWEPSCRGVTRLLGGAGASGVVQVSGVAGGVGSRASPQAPPPDLTAGLLLFPEEGNVGSDPGWFPPGVGGIAETQKRQETEKARMKQTDGERNRN